LHDGENMNKNYSNIIKELIEVKEQYLKDIEHEILLLGMYSELGSKNNLTGAEQNDTNLIELKLKLLKIYESYYNDIEFEINMIAEYIVKSEEINKLQNIIDEEISKEKELKKKYDDLANSKLGKLQRLWWRVVKKIKKG